MIDVAVLAGSIVSSFLLPVAKETLNGIREKVTEMASEAAGNEAAGLAQRVWNRVRDAFRDDDAEDTEILDRFQLEPEETLKELEQRLREILSRDAELRDTLEASLKESSESAAAPISQLIGQTVGQVNIRGDVTGGQVSGVNIGPQSPAPENRR